MMIAGMTTATVLNASVAKADGFNCVARSTGMNIKLFNHVDLDKGTRAAAVLVLSNPAIQSPNKTIAKFSDANQTLAAKGYGKYEAKVDLRYNDSGRAGENVGGTKLGQLKSIILDLNFSYNTLDVELAKVSNVYGIIKYVKRNGEINTESVTCARYLKNGAI